MKQSVSVAKTAYPASWASEDIRVDVIEKAPQSHLQLSDLGPLMLVNMRCGTVTIEKSGYDAHGADRILTFVLQVKGRSTFRHYDQQTALGEGDFTLCDNSAPYHLAFEGACEVIMLRIPAVAMKDMMPTPDCFCGRRLDRNVSLASTAAAMAIDLAGKDDAMLSPYCRERAARHLMDVLASSYASAFDDMIAGSSLMAGRHWRVKLYIEQHLRDPRLSPSTIAEGLKLSDRYLRMIFAVSDESPSTYILRRRLEECARQLLDPRWRGHSITDIAFSWGFNSAPHFARTFRERFDTSPRDYRQQRHGAALAPVPSTPQPVLAQMHH